MSLRNDRSTAAKMVCCSELIRRLEQRGIGETLPKTARVLRETDAQAATAYIEIHEGGPREHEVLERDPRREDDVQPDAFAFGLTIKSAEDLDRVAIDAARQRLEMLLEIHESQR